VLTWFAAGVTGSVVGVEAVLWGNAQANEARIKMASEIILLRLAGLIRDVILQLAAGGSDEKQAPAQQA
jgi:hypothetical protein